MGAGKRRKGGGSVDEDIERKGEGGDGLRRVTVVWMVLGEKKFYF